MGNMTRHDEATTAMSGGPKTTDVRTMVFEVPTDRPEADGTMAWTATTVVVVEVDAGGHTGTGWSYTAASAAALVGGHLAGQIRGRSALDTPALWSSMVAACRNLGRPGLASCAISAVDTALWDLGASGFSVGSPGHGVAG